MKFDKEFKRAISNLPSSEKDKLIFRMLKQNIPLANRLLFELVSTDTIDIRREKIEVRIKDRIQQIVPNYYSPGYLMMDIRDLSGDITRHVNTTRDKYGEASLNLLLLNETLINFNSKIEQESIGKSYKLCIYIIAKTFKILILINSLHEDYLIEFKDQLVNVGQQISKNRHLMKIAINNGLDVNWLLQANIPNNINEIHKNIRSQGFLK